MQLKHTRAITEHDEIHTPPPHVCSKLYYCIMGIEPQEISPAEWGNIYNWCWSCIQSFNAIGQKNVEKDCCINFDTNQPTNRPSDSSIYPFKHIITSQMYENIEQGWPKICHCWVSTMTHTTAAWISQMFLSFKTDMEHPSL